MIDLIYEYLETLPAHESGFLDGLYPLHWNTTTGRPSEANHHEFMYSWIGEGDSFYEYLLKLYILSGF